jgi:hypothetical protein
MSVDGFVAGPGQSLDNPLGEGGELLHRWMFEQPEVNAAEIAAQTSAGAYVMGRHMFGPGHGEWDDVWRGWWGEDPPYHAPGLRIDAPPARAPYHAGRHDVHLRHRRR